MNFTIKQNDTLPSLESQLLDVDGSPVNLEMCGVMFYMKGLYGTKEVFKSATITDAAQGKITVNWLSEDTDTPGLYKCELEVTFTDDSILTVPNGGYFYVHIVPDIGG